MNSHWSPWAGGGPEFTARRRSLVTGDVEMARRHDLTPGGELLPEIDTLIKDYSPRRMEAADWERGGELAKEWVRGACPTDRQKTQGLIRTCVFMIRWADELRLPLDEKLLFGPEMVDQYVKWAITTFGEKTAVTQRVLLHRYGRTLAAPDSWPALSPQLPRNKVVRPLSVNTEAALLKAAQASSIQFEAFCALGFGCGLDGRWLPHIRGIDVSVVDGWPYVQVPDPDPRFVPLRHRYAESIIRAAEAAGEDYLIGSKGGARNRAYYIARCLSLGPGRRLNVTEMRATWFAAHLQNNTDLRYLQKIAGLTSFFRMVEVLEYLDEPEWGPIDLAARGA